MIKVIIAIILILAAFLALIFTSGLEVKDENKNNTPILINN